MHSQGKELVYHHYIQVQALVQTAFLPAGPSCLRSMGAHRLGVHGQGSEGLIRGLPAGRCLVGSGSQAMGNPSD